jgi:hypothetical protein
VNISCWFVETTRLQRHERAKAKAGNDDGPLELGLKPGKGSLYIVAFIVAVVIALADAGAAKVEAEGGPSEAPLLVVEHLHGVVDDLVVHGAAAGWVGVAYQSGEGSFG